jgi:hypothetical protein
MADYQATPDGVLRLADGAFIPASPGNSDWQAYLEWVEAGNTADASPAAPMPLIEADMTFWGDPWQAIAN